MDASRVSIVCTVRDEADNIAALLDSMLAQTRPADEIVINDCGSHDAASRSAAKVSPVKRAAAPTLATPRSVSAPTAAMPSVTARHTPSRGPGDSETMLSITVAIVRPRSSKEDA